MKITIFGTGYVGLVTGSCLAEVGNEVLCIDIDQSKIDNLNSGHIPIYEPGLDELVTKNAQSGNLIFTMDIEQGVQHGLFQMIAVGTPPDENGSADLQHVLAVAKEIGKHMDAYKIIVDKSTVPVGTADKVKAVINRALEERHTTFDFDVVANPEFLKEGAAIDDFMKPERIIVGTDNPRTTELLKILYAPFNRNRDRVIAMDIRSAELTKYSANIMLATKISVMNELSNIAEQVGADIEQVRIGIGSDPRIGYHFIYPGAGYGGSCFPKDVRALVRTAEEIDYDAKLLRAVDEVNDQQKKVLFNKITDHFQGKLTGKTFALWGLSFKPNTDDMREAPSRILMEALWQAGSIIRAYDPKAITAAKQIYTDRSDLIFCDSQYSALENAEALIIVTEWNEFRSPDFSRIKTDLNQPVIFDGRNLFEPKFLKNQGFIYYSIGRSQ